ncbi:MAG: hypothetical protein WBF17_10045, partial [Phycisphaerae bacterium]
LDGKMTKINCGPGSPALPGTAGILVAPAAPTEAEEADTADPGEMAEVKARQREQQAGKYGKVQVKPYKPPELTEEEQEEKTWIEIRLVDQEDKPVPGERYRITLPDGTTVAEGTLDHNGLARVDGIDPGTCQVTFPDRDGETWQPKAGG